LEGVEQTKKGPKNSGKAFSDALLMSRFQNFAAHAAKKGFLKPRFAKFRLVYQFELIREDFEK